MTQQTRTGKLVVYALAAAFLCAVFPLRAAEDWFDDFESYEPLSTIRGQGGWDTWDQNPGADGQVSQAVASSGTNSLRIAGSSDVVMVFDDIAAGVWAVSAKVYVPSVQRGAAWFILMNTYEHGSGAPKNWSVELSMSAERGTIEDMGGSEGGSPPGGSLPLMTDAWAEIVVEIDLDNNFHSIYYNGEVLRYGTIFAGGVGSQVALRAIDLWSDNSTPVFFDDVGVRRLCVPVSIQRNLELLSEIPVEGVDTMVYEEGDLITVYLDLVSPRSGDQRCPPLGNVTITEILPPGWTATEISDGGVSQDGAVKWTIPAQEVTEKSLSYKTGGPAPFASFGILGTVTENGNTDVTHVLGGEILTTSGLGRDGSIVSWLLLGPFAHTAGRPPQPAVMRGDHLTDGQDVSEDTVMPEPEDEVETDFTQAASTGLEPASNPDINPNGIPQWYLWRNTSVRVELGADNLYGAVDDVMCYAVCYLCADRDMTVSFRAGSDDGIQVLLNGQEIWINGVDRAWPGLADQFTGQLKQGANLLMVKVFESGGAWNFGVQVRDQSGATITEGLGVALETGACEAAPPTGFKRGDSNADGTLNIADAVSLLSHLFGGDPLPVCPDASDANDDGQLNIADAVSILSHLFGGAGDLPPPFGTCGPDPTDDGLKECAYPQEHCQAQ